MSTKKEMTGTCPYCGQEVMVEAYTEAQANNEAAKLCKCDNIIKRRENLKALIEMQCGEGASDYGMDPMKEDTVQFIKNAGECILEGDAEVCSIRTGITIVLIKKTKDGVRVTRKDAKATQAEI